MYSAIERKFNDFFIYTIQFLLPSLEDIAAHYQCQLSFSNCESCYMFQAHSNKGKIIINNMLTPPLQHRDFFHELTHHLLHASESFENEYQARITCLFLLIPRDHLVLFLKNQPLHFNQMILELSDIYMLPTQDIYLRIYHFYQNNKKCTNAKI